MATEIAMYDKMESLKNGPIWSDDVKTPYTLTVKDVPVDAV